jgi:hypothetical protein
MGEVHTILYNLQISAFLGSSESSRVALENVIIL